MEYGGIAASQDYSEGYVTGSYRMPTGQQYGGAGYRNADMTSYYTKDTQFLKDTQTLLKTYKPKSYCDIYNIQDYNEIMSIWDEIKNDTGFKEKYHYINWPMWEFLNKSDGFLQLMSVYNLISPILSFFVPVVILIIPFFIIKMKQKR